VKIGAKVNQMVSRFDHDLLVFRKEGQESGLLVSFYSSLERGRMISSFPSQGIQLGTGIQCSVAFDEADRSESFCCGSPTIHVLFVL